MHTYVHIHRLLPLGRGQRCVRTKVKRVCQVGFRGGGSLLPSHSPNTLQAHLKNTPSTLQAHLKHTPSTPQALPPPGAHFGAPGSQFSSSADFGQDHSFCSCFLMCSERFLLIFDFLGMTFHSSVKVTSDIFATLPS